MANVTLKLILVSLVLTAVSVYSQQRERNIASDWILNKNYMESYGRSAKIQSPQENLKVAPITRFLQPEGREAKVFSPTTRRSTSAFNSCIDQLKGNRRFTMAQMMRACSRYSTWGVQARRPATYRVNKKASDWFSSLG